MNFTTIEAGLRQLPLEKHAAVVDEIDRGLALRRNGGEVPLAALATAALRATQDLLAGLSGRPGEALEVEHYRNGLARLVETEKANGGRR